MKRCVELLLACGLLSAPAYAEPIFSDSSWSVTRTEPASDEEMPVCRLSSKTSLVDFHLQWDPSSPWAMFVIELSHGRFDPEEYEGNTFIDVQFDKEKPTRLSGELSKAEKIYFAHVEEPKIFFEKMAESTSMIFGNERLGYAIQGLRKSGKAILAFNDCVELKDTASQEKTLPYGSRIGMDVTIVGSAALDSNLAEIRIEHRPENAKSYCTEYENDGSEECLKRTLRDVQVRDRIFASCASGEFSDVFGHRFRFEGDNAQAATNNLGAFLLRDLETDAFVEFNIASGYDIALAAFSALCPSRTAARE